MKLKIGKDQGYVIIDDNTGRIMSILVKDGVKDKFDFRTFTSYNKKEDKHYNIRLETKLNKKHIINPANNNNRTQT